MIFTVFQAMLFHDGKIRARFLHLIFNTVAFEGLIQLKRAPDCPKDCS